MSRFRMEVLVTPRPGLLDPQGKAIQHALTTLGYDQVEGVRVGKAIYVDLDADSSDEARTLTDELCRKLLANPVTEDFSISQAGERKEAGAR